MPQMRQNADTSGCGVHPLPIEKENRFQTHKTCEAAEKAAHNQHAHVGAHDSPFPPPAVPDGNAHRHRTSRKERRKAGAHRGCSVLLLYYYLHRRRLPRLSSPCCRRPHSEGFAQRRIRQGAEAAHVVLRQNLDRFCHKPYFGRDRKPPVIHAPHIAGGSRPVFPPHRHRHKCFRQTSRNKVPESG